MRIKGFRFTIILVVLSILSACGGGSFGPGEMTSVTITPSPLTLAAGKTQQLTATATFAGSSPQDITKWPSVKWSVSDTSIATITVGGLLTAVAPGTVTVRAQVEGSVGTWLVVTVTQ